MASSTIRREQRRKVHEHRAYLEATMMNSETTGPAGQGIWGDAKPALDRAMSKLSERERDALLLRFFESRSFPEIGQVLRISEDAARRRVDRALDKLRVRLSREVAGTSTIAALAALLAESGATAAPISVVAKATATGLLGGAGAIGMALGSATSPWLIFMTTTKAMIGLSSVFVLAIGLAYYEHIQADILPTKLALVTRENLQIQTRSQTALDAQSVPSAAKELRIAKADTIGSLTATGPWKGFETDPEKQRKYINNQMMQVRLHWAPLWAFMGLSPEQFEKAINLAEEKQWKLLDLNTAAISMGLSPSDPTLRWIIMQANLDFFRQWEDLVGITGITKSHLGEELVILSPLAAALYDTDTPLTSTQANNLAQLISAQKHDGKAWTNIIAQAPSVLKPEQLPALSALAAQVQFQLALNRASSTRPGTKETP